MPSMPGKKSFLDLPPETRVRVYHYLFSVVEVRIDCELRTLANGEKGRACYSSLVDCSGQLLRTCRTVLTEALPVLMGHTLVSFTRHLDAFYCLKSCIDIESHPRAQDIRRLSIDIDAESDAQLILNPNRKPDLLMIDFLEITCQSVDWQTPSLAQHEPRQNPPQYDVVHREIVAGAVQLLIDTRLDTLEDKSKNGVKIILQLVRTKASSNSKATPLKLKKI